MGDRCCAGGACEHQNIKAGEAGEVMCDCGAEGRGRSGGVVRKEEEIWVGCGGRRRVGYREEFRGWVEELGGREEEGCGVASGEEVREEGEC